MPIFGHRYRSICGNGTCAISKYTSMNRKLFRDFHRLFAGIITAWRCLQPSMFTIAPDIELLRAIKPHSVWKIINACQAFNRNMLAPILAIKVSPTFVSRLQSVAKQLTLFNDFYQPIKKVLRSTVRTFIGTTLTANGLTSPKWILEPTQSKYQLIPNSKLAKCPLKIMPPHAHYSIRKPMREYLTVNWNDRNDDGIKRIVYGLR